MREQYLPVRESLGYKNVKAALQKIFEVNLDEIEIDVGEYEDFSFSFHYQRYEMDIIISSTAKHKQFEYGEGGLLTVLLPNPDYPRYSIYEQTIFSALIKDQKLRQSIHRVLGRDESKVEWVLVVLKWFLDSPDAEVL